MTIFDAFEQQPQSGPPGRLSFGFVLAPDFTLVALAGFLAVLRQAGDVGDKSQQVRCTWTVMGANLEPVKASAGIQVLPWENFRDPSEFDYVVIVGGLLRQQHHYQKSLLEYLKLADSKHVPLIGLCTGSFYMAEAGLMAHRKCCVHWYHFQEFNDAFPNAIPVTDEIFIIDGNRITCPGGTSSTDLALHLVEQHLGKERAVKSVRHLLLDWIRPHNHPQMPFTQDYSSIADPRIRKAVYLMEQNLGREQMTLREIAGKIHMSIRQMERLFQDHLGQSPLSYDREMRVRYAHWLLVNTERSVTDIAYECGFSDGSHLNRWVKKHYGCSPLSLRRKMKKS